MKKLYVIAGCNGAGKTTASFTILPETLACKEFVNADEIAKGLSPFQPEKAGIEAGRIMLTRMNSLLESGATFAFETTLSTKSYVHFIKKAKLKGYTITLLFFYLSSPNLAVARVKIRVQEGGHNIPEAVIRRRYEGGLTNFFKLYLEMVDNWMFINHSGAPYQVVAEGTSSDCEIANSGMWEYLKTNYDGE